MKDFKVGDTVWNIECNTFGNFYPTFTEGVILESHKLENEESYLIESDEYKCIIYKKYCFETKNDAIDNVIAHLESQKD